MQKRKVAKSAKQKVKSEWKPTGRIFKTVYLMNPPTDRKPELKYLHVFYALCYPTNDFEDIGKLQTKADIGIFIDYSPSKKAYRIYNKKDETIRETMNVQFDKLTQMASEQHGLGPDLQGLTSGHIMLPRIRTQSVGRPVAESRGRGMGGRVGRGGGKGRRPRGEEVNENVDGVNEGAPDFSTIISQNVIVNGNRLGCSYKEFLACNPKEYDGKGGDVVLTQWIEKMESVQDTSGSSIDKKMKYIVGSLVGKALL
ncbi:hypothetical protein Tco_0977631 [Tanacetum coccineum]|uniref:Retroviral polymerase SH3-like domain-containing protein n=1 Tax=Tanacetum coccineum TaxID=301880 RepID=A0ABQ5EKR6_9ASTR